MRKNVLLVLALVAVLGFAAQAQADTGLLHSAAPGGIAVSPRKFGFEGVWGRERRRPQNSRRDGTAASDDCLDRDCRSG